MELQDAIKQMENIDGYVENVKHFMGNIAAEKEWNDNPIQAKERFLYTKAYRDFLDPDALVLLGRNGTGKTSIVRCMVDEINSPINTTYDFAVTTEFDDIVNILIKESTDFNDPTIICQLRKIIVSFINTIVMLKIYTINEQHDHISKIKTYLEKMGVLNSKTRFQNSIKRITSTLENATQLSGKMGEYASDLLIFMNIIKKFNEAGYSDALDEMQAYLSNKKVLVMLDTSDYYNIKDPRVVICTKTLIDTCFYFYNSFEANRILLKISLPSEIYTILVDQLPGKQRYNTVIIQWSNKDLIKMVAIRLLECSKSDKGRNLLCFEGHYDYSDFHDENPEAYENALKIIGEILPEKCETSLNLTCPTVYYCIRHTLKKPREMMIIFNYFLTGIKNNNDMKFFIKNPCQIKNYVHSTQEEMIGSALSMYETPYEGITVACGVVLHGKPFVLRGKDFDHSIKEAVSHSVNFDEEDIRRILMESGLVGIMRGSAIIRSKDSVDDSKEIEKEKWYRVIRASYEYQIKGRQEMHKDTKCVIHPMCYEHFECLVRLRTLVFPDRLDQDDTMSIEVKVE